MASHTITDLLAYNFNIQKTEPVPESFMHLLAKEGDLLSAEVVFDAGHDINHRNEEGKTPLHEAAFYGHLDMIKFFLENNAEINAETKQSKKTPLFLAVQEGHHDIVKYLIQKGAKLQNIDQSNGNGLLHLTSINKDIIMAGILIAAGIDVFHENKQSKTARDLAAENNDSKLEKTLLRVMAHHAIHGS